MDPISMLAIGGAAVGVVGSLVGAGAAAAGAAQQAAGALYTGEAQSAMYQYQAGVATYNEQVARSEAADTAGAGVVPLTEAGLTGREAVAQIKAGEGASNVALGTGSAKSVVEGQTETTQMTEGTTQYNTDQQVYAQRVTASQQQAQAAEDVSASQTSLVAGQLGRTSAIIAGAGNVAQKFTQIAQSVPAFGKTSGPQTTTVAAGGAIGGGGAAPTSDTTGFMA